MCSGAGSATAAADGRGDERGEPVLAVDPDVEQVHPEADRHGERRRGSSGDAWLRSTTDRRDLLPAGRVAEVEQHHGDAADGLTAAASDDDQRGDDQRDDAPRAPAPSSGRPDAPARPDRSCGTCRPARRAGHREPSSSGVTSPGSSVGDQPAAQDHRSVSDRPISSSRSAEISRTASPSRAGLLEQVPDRGLRADVHAAGRVGRDQQPRVARSSRGRRSASAGCRRRARRRATSMPGVRTSYSRDDALGVGAGAVAVDAEPLAFGGCGLVAEDAVLPQRRLEQQALPVAVLGDVADAGLAALRRVRPAR